MENFVVSARKYRPATFDMVVGQQSITTTLKNAIKNNHLAQAFLFTGPRGVGKTTCARILAKTINCQNLSENQQACDSCPPCLSFNQSNSFNVHELDAASNNSVEGIRNLVDQVRIPPQVGKYKVYIIDEVHMLSTNAFNAFLKTLEEPPAYAKFILATTERHKIIPTILSRCQIFDFARITVEDITTHLQYVAKSENITAEYNALHIIAKKADGGLRDALSVFDQMVSFTGNNITYKQVIDNLNVLDYDYFFRITQMILQGKPSDMLLLINEIILKGFEGSDFITGFGEHLRNLLVCKDPATIKLIEVSDDIREQYLGQTQQCPEDFLLRALDINNRADIQYKASSNKRLTLEISLLQIAGLLKKKDLIEAPVNNQTLVAPQSPESMPVAAASAPPAVSSGTPAYAPSTQQPVKESLPAAPITQVVAEPSFKEAESQQPVAAEVKPVETESPARPVQTPASSVSPIRIKKALSLKVNQPAKPDEDIDKPPSCSLDENPLQEDFSLTMFFSLWKKFAESLKDESPSLYAAMTQCDPKLLPDSQVEILLDNTIQEEALMERRQQLLGYLRKELNNYSLKVVVRIREITQESKAYLPVDKFKKLTDKNPSIIRLQKDLDLDFLY